MVSLNVLVLTSWMVTALAIVPMPTVTIAPGVDMPLVSCGHPDDHTQEADEALLWFKYGGTGIDTAFNYRNQGEVATAIQTWLASTAGAKRSDIFVTSKISPDDCTAEAALAAVQENIEELKLDYIDLLLHHFPCATEDDNKAIWTGLQHALAANLTRAIGVSNYENKDIDAVLSIGGVAPAVNQCQMSVGSHDDTTIKYCQQKGITYESYSPLRHANLSDARIVTIANAHDVTTAQIALRWIVQQGLPLATSPGTNAEFVQEDLDLFSFVLTDNEMAVLAAM